MADGQDQAGAPIVSVLMANHNGALYLEAALKSVLEQTLAELEVIVVDDASTDRSRDIVEHIVRSRVGLGVIHERGLAHHHRARAQSLLNAHAALVDEGKAVGAGNDEVAWLKARHVIRRARKAVRA